MFRSRRFPTNPSIYFSLSRAQRARGWGWSGIAAQIRRQAEGIVAVVVLQAEGWVQAHSTHGARHDGPQHRVAVVQVPVLIGGVSHAAESRIAEQARPVDSRGLGFDVFGVARAHAAAQAAQASVVSVELGQQPRLRPHLRADNLLPEPYPPRFAKLNLARQYRSGAAAVWAGRGRSGSLRRVDYNAQGPHSSLGYKTPEEFAAAYAAAMRPTGSTTVPVGAQTQATWEEKREDPPVVTL
jgi:hypothetical protein